MKLEDQIVKRKTHLQSFMEIWWKNGKWSHGCSWDFVTFWCTWTPSALKPLTNNHLLCMMHNKLHNGPLSYTLQLNTKVPWGVNSTTKNTSGLAQKILPLLMQAWTKLQCWFQIPTQAKIWLLNCLLHSWCIMHNDKISTRMKCLRLANRNKAPQLFGDMASLKDRTWWDANFSLTHFLVLFSMN